MHQFLNNALCNSFVLQRLLSFHVVARLTSISYFKLKEFVVFVWFNWQIWFFMAWFPISCALCHSQSIIQATSKWSTCFGCHCALLDATCPFVTITSTNYLDVFVDLWGIFYHILTILMNVIHIHSNGNTLPSPTYLWLLHVNLELGRHQSTFFHAFIICFHTSDILFVMLSKYSIAYLVGFWITLVNGWSSLWDWIGQFFVVKRLRQISVKLGLKSPRLSSWKKIWR